MYLVGARRRLPGGFLGAIPTQDGDITAAQEFG
jgi:hypothetical protein